MLLNINAGNNTFHCFPVCRKWNSVTGWKGRDYIKGSRVNCSLSPWVGKYLALLLLHSLLYSMYRLGGLVHIVVLSWRSSPSCPCWPCFGSFCWAFRECGNGYFGWNWNKCFMKVPRLAVGIQARGTPTQHFIPTHVVDILCPEHQLFCSADLFLLSCTAC